VKLKVFLSWSGIRSSKVASALREWLPLVINDVEPWMSEEDIAAGARWSLEIAGSLEKSGFGIICVTPENRERPWLLFEAGALAKAFESARVVPYLFGFKDKSLPGSPLSQLQAKLSTEGGTFDLVKSLNDALGDRKLDAKRLEKSFAKWWPELELALKEIPESPPDAAPASPQPSTDERLAELLDLARAQKAEIESMSEVVRNIPATTFLLGRGERSLASRMFGPNRQGVSGSLASLDRALDRAENEVYLGREHRYVAHNPDDDDDKGRNG